MENLFFKVAKGDGGGEMLRILERENGEKEHHPKFHPPKADEIHPSRRLWRPQKNVFPKGRRLPLKAGGE
jgi:hypothetical protein